MTHNVEGSGVTREIAQRMRELRGKRGLTGAGLGERMTGLGVPWDRSIVANLESGRRRSVTVDELLALALALNCPPMYLLIPPDAPGEPYAVTPAVSESRRNVAAWFAGEGPILPRLPLVGDIREFYAELPEDKFYAMTGATEDEVTE
jgi:transcriptional regulator with XRE-family HTH domain